MTMSNEEARQRLLEIENLVKSHQEMIKPYFGLLFWECLDLGSEVDPNQLAQHGMQMNMQGEGDEVLAEFLAAFIEIWRGSGDITAASRFVATALQMSAAELLESRSYYLKGRG